MTVPTIDDVRKLVNSFKATLPKEVWASSVTLNSKTPFKAVVLREALIHRVTSLAESAIAEFDAGRWVSATIMIRAIVETTAVLHSLELQLERALQEKNDDALTEFLRRTMVSSRSESSLPEAINVLSLIDKADKDFPGFRKHYDELSEYAHPNWCGALGAFSENDFEKHVVTFDTFDRPSARDANIAGMMACLTVAQHVYNSCSKKLEDLNDAFNRGDITNPP